MDTETVAQGPQGVRANLDWTEHNGKFTCLICEHDGIELVTGTKTGMLSHFRFKHQNDHPVGIESPDTRPVPPKSASVTTNSKGQFLCPECLEKGIERPYNALAGLGGHRSVSHNYKGVSPAVAYHHRMKLERQAAATQKAKQRAAKKAAAAAPEPAPAKLERGKTGLPLFDSEIEEPKPMIYNTKKNQMKIKILGLLAETQEMTLTGLNRRFTKGSRDQLPKLLNEMAKEGLILNERKAPSGRGRIANVYTILGPGQRQQTVTAQQARSAPDEAASEGNYPCFYCDQVFSGRDQRGRTRHIKVSHPGQSWASADDSVPIHLQTSNILAATNAQATLVIPNQIQQPGRIPNGNEHLNPQDGHFITDDQLAKIQAEWRAAGYLERTLHELAHQQNEAGRDFTKRSAEILLYLARR